jgi:hypothetical protein
MHRHKFRMVDYLEPIDLTRSKKDILSDYYYKYALKTKHSYENEISMVMNSANISASEKEKRRDELIKEMQSDIDSIYKMNKVNPQ